MKKLWRWLTEPFPRVKDVEDRHNARLVASLFITLLPLGLVIVAVPPLVDQPPRGVWSDLDVQGLLVGLLFWSVTYWLTRLGYYRPATVFAIMLASVVIFVISPGIEDFEDLRYLLMPVILASLVLPLWVTLAYIAANLLALLVVPQVFFSVPFVDVLIRPFSFFLLGSTLIIVTSLHRDKLDRERRRTLEQTAEALRRSEARYRFLVEHIPAVIYTTNLENPPTVQYVSPQITALTGYPPEAWLSDPQLWYRSVHPEDLPLLTGSDALAGRPDSAAPYQVEYRLRTRSGGEVWVQDKSFIIPDETGGRQVRQGFMVDITDRKQTEARLQTSLREKEVLLQEIHHRVKNNLQVIASLLNLQTGYLHDPLAREAFIDSQNRIRSMALIHEKLYRSHNLAQIDLASYIEDLSAFLFRSSGVSQRGIRLKLETVPVFLEIDEAVPCGLILNELLTNALKHAFPGNQAGEVQVILEVSGDGLVTFSVVDTGVGLPPDINVRESESLGLMLVNTLVDQLDGTLQVESNEGARFSVSFRPKISSG